MNPLIIQPLAGRVLPKRIPKVIIMVKMKTNPLKSLDQDGFIPMLILILLVVGAIIYVVYTRVLHVSK